ncbi:MAG: BA14K family protein [Pseudolabrys sp.]|nr:BA14K family protein [Pseudolabrys sp.]
MNVIVYFFVALIAAGSVLFGLDVVPAPMSPMPASQYEIRAAVLPQPPAPVVAKVEPSTAQAAPVAAAPVAVPAQVVAAPAAVPPPAPEQQPSSIIADEPVTAAAPAPRCDVDACAAAYRTFDAADCTYKPSEGPRRLCTRGTPPAAVPPAAVPTAAAQPSSEARAQACNVAACSQAYPRSFNAADCTFNPSEGPRRVCTR